MFGLTLSTIPFAIAGAIGASIPLILHLLNRERARRLIFSTVRFIQMSHQTNVRRHKLKRLLLLLMRILMLALLGLAFARPFFAAIRCSHRKQVGNETLLLFWIHLIVCSMKAFLRLLKRRRSRFWMDLTHPMQRHSSFRPTMRVLSRPSAQNFRTFGLL